MNADNSGHSTDSGGSAGVRLANAALLRFAPASSPASDPAPWPARQSHGWRAFARSFERTMEDCFGNGVEDIDDFKSEPHHRDQLGAAPVPPCPQNGMRRVGLPTSMPHDLRMAPRRNDRIVISNPRASAAVGPYPRVTTR